MIEVREGCLAPVTNRLFGHRCTITNPCQLCSVVANLDSRRQARAVLEAHGYNTDEIPL